VSLNVTEPLKWFTAVTVIVEVADWVTSTAAGEVAVIVKSVTWKRAVVEWTRLPLVPVTVSV
jgi:hypothetical protein